VLLVTSAENADDDELGSIHETLRERGYDPRNAVDLPGVESRTDDENTAVYMMLSRFSILVDRDPSQRLTEYETAKAHNNVLARLVPADRTRQTTHMIGGHEDADIEHVADFEFEDDLAEVLDEAIAWAESVVEDRRESTHDRFPWRGTS